MIAGLPVRWVPREPPLRPIAVWASGAAARLLARRLLSDRDPAWRGLGGPGWLLVLGDDPPWVDGAVFLGRDALAPRLLLPTASRPEAAGVPVSGLVERRVAASCTGRPGPFAVVPGRGAIPTGAARVIDEAGLDAWHAQ